MLSTNIDLSQVDVNSRDTETLNVETLFTKQSLRDCEADMVESNTTSSLVSSVSSNLKKAHSALVLNASFPSLNGNSLTKLQGQKWHQFFDYDKVMKQMRCAEKANLKTTENEYLTIASSSNSKSSPYIASVTSNQKYKQANQKQKQVKRLSGNDMQYYGLAPKQKALEIVICNVCKGIYTKVGFNNHMFLQHTAIWSAVPTKVCFRAEELALNSVLDCREENMADIEHIELSRNSPDSSTISSCIMSSSSQTSSSFGSSTRALKGNRMSCGSTSSNGRSRCKLSKTQQLPASTSTCNTVESAVQSVTQLMLSTTDQNSKSLNSIKFPSKTTIASPPITTAKQSNVKMLPTFGVESALQHPSNTPVPTVVGLSGSFSHSSNSSTSSSSISTISSKSSSQSKTSPLSIAFPTSSPLPITDAATNVTAQFEMVSSSTPFHVGSKDTTRDNVYFSTDSFIKTEENLHMASVSELRDLTVASAVLTPKIGSSNTDIQLLSSDVDLDNKVSNVQLGLVLTQTTKPEEYYQIMPVSLNNQMDSIDFCSTSESITSSTSDVLQTTKNTLQHNNNLNKFSSNLVQLQMSTVLTTRISPTLTLTKSNTYAAMGTKIGPENCFANKLNFDKICGVSVSDEFGICTACTQPLTCVEHSHSLKRQVSGRSKPFDELLAHYSCKEVKGTLVGQEINATNSQANGTLDRRNIYTTLVAVPNMLSAPNDIIIQNKAINDNLSTIKFLQPVAEKCHQNSQENITTYEANVPLRYTISRISSYDKSKLGSPSVSSSNLPQMQMPSSERFCDEQQQSQNSSDENSILTLGSIFDHNTQIELLDSKFITEILNTAESDINFDDIDGSSASTPTASVQARLNKPAIKILRLEDDSPQKALEMGKTLPASDSQQLNSFVADKQSSMLSNQTIKLESSNVYADVSQQHEIPYQQADHKNVRHVEEQDQITSIERIHFHQLLQQQCCLNNSGDNMFNKQQHLKHNQHLGDYRSNELIALSIDDEVIKAKNVGEILSLNNFSSDVKAKEKTAFGKYDIDEDTCEEMEWNLSVFDVPSLSDDNNEGITIKSLFDYATNHQRDGVDHHGRPTADDIFFEVTTDSSVTMQQKQAIAELLNQRDFKLVADVHLNNNNKIETPGKLCVQHFDFSLIDSSTCLKLSGKNLETKPKTLHKQNFDQPPVNIDPFSFLPRPFTFNNFSLIKFPLSLATVFHRDLLSSRKANNNLIALTRNGSSFLGNCINGCFIGCQSISMHNTSKSISNVASLNSNGGINNNLLNELPISNVVVSNPLNGSSLAKHQRNDNIVQNSAAGSNSVMTSSSNGIMIAHRFQKNILNNSISNSPAVNGKSKVVINTAAPIAVINPSRLSNTGQLNQSNSTFANSTSFGRNMQISGNISSETDRINLVKRSSITKPSTVKSTFFTPKIINELMGCGSSSTANFLGHSKGNSDNTTNSYTIKYYRNKSLYAKRTILKLSQQQRGGVKKSVLNIFKEKKHKPLQKVFP